MSQSQLGALPPSPSRLESWQQRRIAFDGEPGGPDLRTLRASLAAGGVIAFPTESLYGLGADPRSQTGVASVFEIKGRPADKPLPVVVADLDQAADLGVDLNHPGLVAVAPLWPAALTVVVPVARPLPATAGSTSVALRIPDHTGLRTLLGQLGHGLTATSANRSGAPGIWRASELELLLRAFDAWWLDGGDLAGGEPSTVVGWDRASDALRLLRPGRYQPPSSLLVLAGSPPSQSDSAS